MPNLSAPRLALPGPPGPSGPPTVTPGALTSDYDQSIRQTGPRGGPFQLLFRRNRELYLNDRNDIDATGATDMASTIATYLSEFAAGPSGAKLHVYCESGSTYKVNSTVDVPAYTTVQGPPGSGIYQSTGLAEFKAGTSGVTMLRLAGAGASLQNLRIHLNNQATTVGVRPNMHRQRIEHCLFFAATADSTGVKGGGFLYFTMTDCAFSGGWNGRAVDLLKAYADNPGAVYYGVNVGWFERNLLGGHGALRFSGILTVRDNDFEGGVGTTGAPATIELAQTDAGTTAVVEDNYFEIAGANAVYANTGGAALRFTGNIVLGTQAAAGSYGVKFNGYTAQSLVENNLFRTETGIVYAGVTDTNSPGLRIGFNNYQCATPISGIATTSGNNNGGAANGMAMIQDPVSGLRVLGTALVPTIRRPQTEATLYLNRANTWQMNYSSPTTVTPQSGTAVPGTQFTMYFQKANVTLPTASWHLLSGVDETPPAGATKQFIVDADGTVREVGPGVKPPATKTATFTADTSADVYLCDATTAAITANLPSATTWTGGPLTIKKTDASANAVTVVPFSTQTVDGATTYALSTQYAAITVRPSGGNWFIVNKV